MNVTRRLLVYLQRKFLFEYLDMITYLQVKEFTEKFLYKFLYSDDWNSKRGFNPLVPNINYGISFKEGEEIVIWYKPLPYNVKTTITLNQRGIFCEQN